MITYERAAAVQQIIDNATTIVVLQADNPDGDSLASSLALEHILGDMGKKVALYCAIDMPTYLKYLPGWDRVTKDIPNQLDASIIVDASTMTLFEKLSQTQQKNWIATKPTIVLDHHQEVSNDVPFAETIINDPERASTGELIYLLAKQLGWPLSVAAKECIMTSILGDTQGLSNSQATPETYRIMAELVETGVNRPALEERRRAYTKMPENVFRYKAELIERVEFHHDQQIAVVDVPQKEINSYSPLYNPIPLIQNDMLQVENVNVSVVFKRYDNGRLTAAIRCNPSATIAAQLAEHFGGGGHTYASGFKLTHGRPFNEVKSECITFAGQLLQQRNQESNDETIQHPDQTN